MIKKIIQKLLSHLGYKIHRLKNHEECLVLPTITSYYSKNRLTEQYSIFSVPLVNAVNALGFRYSDLDIYWHPHVQACKEIILGNEPVSFGKFHSLNCPKNAAEAFGIPFQICTPLHTAPYFAARLLVPWLSMSIEQAEAFVSRAANAENFITSGVKHGIEGGDPLYGPLSEQKTKIEIERFSRVIRSIQSSGYIRSNEEDGDPYVVCLERNGELRYIVMTGNHRFAAASALGISHLFARPFIDQIVCLNHVEYWPNVYSGLWSVKDATTYFNHIFDFDSKSWAKKNNMLGNSS